MIGWRWVWVRDPINKRRCNLYHRFLLEGGLGLANRRPIPIIFGNDWRISVKKPEIQGHARYRLNLNYKIWE